jgi:hypothetical protein
MLHTKYGTIINGNIQREGNARGGRKKGEERKVDSMSFVSALINHYWNHRRG